MGPKSFRTSCVERCCYSSAPVQLRRVDGWDLSWTSSPSLNQTSYDEAIARLLEVDLEEDEEDAILPPNLSSWPGSTMGESPSWKCAGVWLLSFLSTGLLSKKGQSTEKDLYDGKRQPSRTSTVSQLIPTISACIAKMQHFWNKPFSHRVPVKGFTRLNIHSMEELGMSN